MANESDRLLVRVPDVAKMLGVCQRVVWTMLATGTLHRVSLPHVKATLIERSEVEGLVRGAVEASR